jgi:hypothetical protein
MDANGGGKSNVVIGIAATLKNQLLLLPIRVYSRPLAVSCDFPPEPRFGHAPLSFYCPRRNIQDLTDFFVGQAAKEAQFDDLALARIEGEEIFQRVVERDQIDAPFRGRRERFVEREFVATASAFFRAMGASVIHEDATHHLGGDSEKMGPVLPGGGALIDEAQIRFVDETGGLQRMIRAFPLQILAGEPAQFFIDERHQSGGRFAVTSAPIDQHASYVFACRR